MHLLKRKRRKRRVVDKYGNEVNKGFQYIYSLSRRGQNYINYMHSTADGKKRDFFGPLSPDFIMEQRPRDPSKQAQFLPKGFPQTNKPSNELPNLEPKDHERFVQLLKLYLERKQALLECMAEVEIRKNELKMIEAGIGKLEAKAKPA